jgi:His/Glu/Gln/Arg/opine family amino acid ABC transporter permease subunit
LPLNFDAVVENLGVLASGAWMTLFVSLVSIVIGMGGGIALSFILLSKHDVPRHIGRAYVSFFRGTPLLGQLLLAYYFLPGLIGIDLPPLVAAIGALALNTMAFQAEIYRGGLLAIAPGQFEAARILGISVWQARRRILIPQMMRLVLPSLINEAISIVKNSSLVSVIAVTELLRVSQGLVAVTFRPTEIYLAAAGIYLLMNLLLAQLGRISEQRLSRHV